MRNLAKVPVLLATQNSRNLSLSIIMSTSGGRNFSYSVTRTWIPSKSLPYLVKPGSKLTGLDAASDARRLYTSKSSTKSSKPTTQNSTFLSQHKINWSQAFEEDPQEFKPSRSLDDGRNPSRTQSLHMIRGSAELDLQIQLRISRACYKFVYHTSLSLICDSFFRPRSQTLVELQILSVAQSLISWSTSQDPWHALTSISKPMLDTGSDDCSRLLSPDTKINLVSQFQYPRFY